MAREAIFLGYRREDTADVAGRVFDALESRFGRERIFKDVDNIPPGADFSDYINRILPRCQVALILIGPNWTEAKDGSGQRRLDDPHDWVRVEVETALATPDLHVVPVLINGARMPKAEELPPSMHPLLRRNAAIIRRDPDFRDDINRLAAALRASVRTGLLDLGALAGERRSGRKSGAAPFIAIAAIAALALGGLALWRLLPTGVAQGSVAGSTTAAQGALRVGQEFDDCANAGWCPRMVVLPAGNVMTGSPQSEPGHEWDEEPQVSVGVSSIAVGKYDVTKAQWAEFVRDTNRVTTPGCSIFESGSGFHHDDQGASWVAPGFTQGDSEPVVCVSLNDAQAYAAWLSQRTGQSYRLLTNAEWEYAARAGTSTPYYWGVEPGALRANCIGCGSQWDDLKTSPSGSFAPNAFGLYDMAGNVYQWVQGGNLRGGSFAAIPRYIRSAHHGNGPADMRENEAGFRVARNVGGG